MRHFISAVVVTFLVVNAAFAGATSLEEPKIPIEQAINVAKQYVRAKKIDVADSYISRAEWHPRSGLVSYWRIDWHNMKYVKGGGTYITVYADEKVEHAFGK